MKIVVIGKVQFTKKLLEKIYSINKKYLIGIVTNSNKDTNDDFENLIPFCKKKKLNYHLTRDINSNSTYKWIKNLNPDFVMCLGYPKLLKGKLLRSYKNKIIGFHPTKLPFNKGRSPIIWSLLLGLKESACTYFFITKKIDDGPIINQMKFKIKKNDNASTLYKKIISIAVKQIPLVINKLKAKKIKHNFKSSVFKKKNFPKNIWRKRSKMEGIIDWRMSSGLIIRHINALMPPYTYAEFKYQKKIFKIIKAKKINYKSQLFEEFGKIVKISKKGFIVKCGDGYISIIETFPKIKINNLKKNIYL